MKICGIIVEYNPLHYGHLHHIQQVKKMTECDVLVAVMSGNFVQRGEPAIVNKHIRTQFALEAGVDIVIELPYIYAVEHADLFSLGAISLLNQCGVDEIIFGSETNDEKKLLDIATFMEKKAFDEKIKQYLNEGTSYPEATHLALLSHFNDKTLLKSNDLLGIQYIRQILRINPQITFKTIKRIHTNYRDTKLSHDKIASATSIRKALKNDEKIEPYLPSHVYNHLKESKLHDWKDYFPYLKYQIISQQRQLKEIHDINEGLENAIIKSITESNGFHDFVSALISKRYTRGKIQRVLTHILNQVTKHEIQQLDIHNGPKYIRLLGFNEKKSTYLKQIIKHSSLPFITNVTKQNYPLLKLDLRVSEIYHLVDNGSEMKIPIIYK